MERALFSYIGGRPLELKLIYLNGWYAELLMVFILILLVLMG